MNQQQPPGGGGERCPLLGARQPAQPVPFFPPPVARPQSSFLGWLDQQLAAGHAPAHYTLQRSDVDDIKRFFCQEIEPIFTQIRDKITGLYGIDLERAEGVGSSRQGPGKFVFAMTFYAIFLAAFAAGGYFGLRSATTGDQAMGGISAGLAGIVFALMFVYLIRQCRQCARWSVREGQHSSLDLSPDSRAHLRKALVILYLVNPNVVAYMSDKRIQDQVIDALSALRPQITGRQPLELFNSLLAHVLGEQGGRFRLNGLAAGVQVDSGQILTLLQRVQGRHFAPNP